MREFGSLDIKEQTSERTVLSLLTAVEMYDEQVTAQTEGMKKGDFLAKVSLQPLPFGC